MTKRMFSATRRQCWKQVLTSILIFVVVVSTSSVVDVAAGPFHLVAVLPAVNYSDWTSAFQEAVSTAAAQDRSGLRVPGLAVSAARGVRTVVGDICSTVDRYNVSAMIVVGDESIINTVLVVARHLGVPLLGYNIEPRSAVSPVCLFTINLVLAHYYSL